MPVKYQMPRDYFADSTKAMWCKIGDITVATAPFQLISRDFCTKRGHARRRLRVSSDTQIAPSARPAGSGMAAMPAGNAAPNGAPCPA